MGPGSVAPDGQVRGSLLGADGVGYHPRHAQRAWRDVVDLLAECVPVTEDPGHDPGGHHPVVGLVHRDLDKDGVDR
ncbi:hypothetical protein ACIRD8_35630 [Streptomyces sp. NPDC102451]|uniref:hypothetical protein n=1 Tax=Streptomyces sp. NPDC102451 TaxID=3366177 RepID=UPI0037F15F67